MNKIQLSLDIACTRLSKKVHETYGIPIEMTLNKLKIIECLELKIGLLKKYFFNYRKEDNEYIIRNFINING